MGADTDARSDERLAAALERLAGIQKSIMELNQEAARIRRHIQDFDVNVDALNLLATARSRDEKSGGGKVLQDAIRYARKTGMQMGAQGGEDVAPVLRDPASMNVTPPALEMNMESREERRPSDFLKLLSQLLVAAAVTTGLFVLIH